MKSWMAVVSPMSDNKIRRTVAGLKTPKTPPSMKGCRQTDRRERRELRERLTVVDEMKLVGDRDLAAVYTIQPQQEIPAAPPMEKKRKKRRRSRRHQQPVMPPSSQELGYRTTAWYMFR